jgi:hypothetical protein
MYAIQSWSGSPMTTLRSRCTALTQIKAGATHRRTPSHHPALLRAHLSTPPPPPCSPSSSPSPSPPPSSWPHPHRGTADPAARQPLGLSAASGSRTRATRASHRSSSPPSASMSQASTFPSAPAAPPSLSRAALSGTCLLWALLGPALTSTQQPEPGHLRYRLLE